MEIFDPLDRDFEDDDGNKMNIDRDELLDRLLNVLEPIKGGEVYAPLSQTMLSKFNQLFTVEYDECERIVAGWCK